MDLADTYWDSSHKRAVTRLGRGGAKRWCDANGNMTSRVVGGTTYTLVYDAENRLSEYKNGANIVESYAYDGDGRRVKSTVTSGNVITAYVGNWYEWNSSTGVTSYYYLGGQRIAMRTSGGETYIHGDHLGSATNTTGYQTNVQRYYAFGAKRGTGTVGTNYRYTGQYEDSTINLYYYNARWYDPALGRFTQPDTVVPEPGNPQAQNRYSYVYNNPLRYTDPTGHWVNIVLGAAGGAIGGAIYGYGSQVASNLGQGMNLGQALTTNIDPTKVAVYAGAGALIGATLGVGVEVAIASTNAYYAAKAAAVGTAVIKAACDDGDCTNEVKAAVNAGSRVGQTTFEWLANDPNRVEHIVAQKHGWGRLVELSGDMQKDYQAIQPYLQEVVTSGTRAVIKGAQSAIGTVVEYSKTINGNEVIVRGIEMANQVFRMGDAWIKK